MKDRRLAHRIEFNPHVATSITCIDADGNIITDSACMTNASLEGVGFQSQTDLQKESEVIICTMFPNLRKNLILEGTIVRKEQDENNMEYSYGVQLYLNEEETEQLLDFLHETISGNAYVGCDRHSNGRYDGPNRREYYRVIFSPHARAILRILAPGQYRYDWQQADICILDFSAAGVRFKTDKDFVVDPTMIFSVEVQLCRENLNIIGNVIRKSQQGKHFVYAMQFISSEDEIGKHVGIVNRLASSKRNGEMHKNYIMCSCR